MGERPMDDAEKTHIQERLDDAKKERDYYNRLVVELEAELKYGTVWCLSQEENAKRWAEVTETCRINKENSDKREIELYGHVLTESENWTGRVEVTNA